jgi:hypothetical protein
VTFTNLRQRLVTLSPLHPFALLVLIALAFTLALLRLPTLALALFYTLLFLLALIDPIFGLYWAILSVPVQELVHLPGGVSYTQGAMLLALGAWRCTYWRTPSSQFSTITFLPPRARRTQRDRSNLYSEPSNLLASVALDHLTAGMPC